MLNKDIGPISAYMEAKPAATRFVQTYNKCSDKAQKTGGKIPGILGLFLRAYKDKALWLILTVPIIVLCAVCNPIAVREFSKWLTPAVYYDCDAMFTDGYKFEHLNYSQGVTKTFLKLWGFLILVFCS